MLYFCHCLHANLLSLLPNSLLTLVQILGSDGEDGVLDVLILIHLSLVQGLVEERRVVILVRNADTDELGH